MFVRPGLVPNGGLLAAGEGSSAAIAINADLVEEDVHIAVRGSRPAPPA